MTNGNCKRATAERQLEWKRPFRETSGSQLVEFALALPMVVVLAIGVMDFAKAYNIKHILTNAAREAARITSSNPLLDSSCTSSTPCSIQAAADDVENYLVNAGLSKASCLKTASASTSGNTYTYSCSSVSLVINHADPVAGGASGGIVLSTQVTLSYPYTFTFGKIIALLVSGATGPNGQQILTASTVMQNMVLN